MLLRLNLLAVALLAAASAASLQFDGRQFRVVDWAPSVEPAAGWATVFRIYAGDPAVVPQMLGSYSVRDRELTFTPRFPPAKGVHYLAIFQTAGVKLEVPFDAPPAATNALTKVERIYPSANVLPSNTLKFYIYFTAPMSRGEAYRHLKLIDLATNRPVEIPFLELEQELWDQNNQRLTLLFDPGRIKRGLVPTSTIGPAIVEGKQYKLVIEREWHDARGVSLVEAAEKGFRCGPSDRIPPAPSSWQITAPRSVTRDALIIVFPKSMDVVLMKRMIGIFDRQSSTEIAGTITIASDEAEWRFTPSQPWQPGTYRLTADNTLEDIAGNHLDRPFDVDVFETVTRHVDTSFTSLTFTVR